MFDWTRTELARKRADGSTVLAYTQAAVDSVLSGFGSTFVSIADGSEGRTDVE